MSKRRIVPVAVGGGNSNQTSTSTVYFEVSDVDVTNVEEGWQDAAAPSGLPAHQAATNLAKAVETVTPIVTQIVAGVRTMGSAAPAEIEVTLGVKLSGKIGFFVAESQGEASIGLKLKWTAAP